MSLLLRFCAAVGILFCAVELRAAVAVVCNRSTVEMRFAVTIGEKDPPAKPRTYSVPAGDLVVITLPRGEKATLAAHGKDYELKADSAYYFGEYSNGDIALSQITLSTPMPEEAEEVIGAKAPEPAQAALKLRSPSIPVKILVDEEEPTRPAIWSRRLRARVAEASEILQKHCGLGLEVVETGTWKSDNEIQDFDRAVAEFVREVDPGKARLAIGFTSQYQVPRGRTRLGGTWEGPLRRHILLREWSNHVSESERLELLVHELGHHLGAVHCPEQNVVMRPVLGDRQARAKKFIIQFDPLNTLAMNLVAEEVRDRGVLDFAGMSLPTKLKLRAIYTDLAKALPSDPAAPIYIRRLAIPAEGK